MIDALRLVMLPIGLGLLGFIEPCSIGASLLFIKSLENRTESQKATQVAIFTTLRAIFMGLLGLFAVVIGGLFFEVQKLVWTIFGLVYVIIGAMYFAGRSRIFLLSVGPRISRIKGAKGSATLAALFALNIPACAGPLLAILVGATATSGASGMSIGKGFLSMALFGFSLSAPILAASYFAVGLSWLDRLSAMSKSVPRITGIILILLGIWSIRFGLRD